MDSPRDMNARGPGRKKRTARYACTMCQYVSNRHFNIVRHVRRIHTVPKRQPQCCDITFESKAEYYLHCEEIHPGKRINSTSQKKYGILAGFVLSESIVDASKLNNRGYPQTRYMLRSRGQRDNNTGLGENSVYYEKDDDSDDEPMESTDKSLKYENKDSLSSSDDEGTSDLNYESENVQDTDEDSFSENSSDNEDLRNSSIYEDQPPGEENKSTKEVVDTPNSIDEKRKDCENRNHEGYSTDINREKSSIDTNHEETTTDINYEKSSADINRQESYGDLIEESVSPPRNNSVPSAIKVSGVKETKAFTRHAEVDECHSALPLKKRILHNFTGWNKENIEMSRKPIGDRLYRQPITASPEVVEISTKCRQSRKERRSLIKKMNSTMCFSTSNDEENVPPEGSFAHSEEALICKLEFRKNRKISWQDVTVRHREYLSSFNFQDIERYRATRYFD